MEDQKRIIEINGVKMEVDLRSARVVSDLRVGDKVKVLIPEYSNSNKIYPGVIVGFENFTNLPTIVIAYLKIEYSGAQLQFLYFNASTEKTEVIPATDDYHLFEKDQVETSMDNAIATKALELQALKDKKAYFLNHFNQYFKPEEAKV